MPLLVIAALSLCVAGKVSQPKQITAIPILISLFFVLQTTGRKLNAKMADWAKRSGRMSLSVITNGDQMRSQRMQLVQRTAS